MRPDMLNDEPRRLGVFWIGERALLDLLGSAKGTTFTVSHNLPDGFKVASVHYDMVTRAWAVVVEHESLPIVDDGTACGWVDRLQLQVHPLPTDVVHEIEDATRPADSPRPYPLMKRLRGPLVARLQGDLTQDATPDAIVEDS